MKKCQVGYDLTFGLTVSSVLEKDGMSCDSLIKYIVYTVFSTAALDQAQTYVVVSFN